MGRTKRYSAGLLVIAVVSGCSASPAAGPVTVTSAVTVTEVRTETVTASAAPASVPATSAGPVTSAASSTVEGGPYLAGDLTVQFPAGEPGQISVVAQGPRSTVAGTQWPIVVRNGTSDAVCGVKGTAAATSGGKLVGSADLQPMGPDVIAAGGLGFGSVYFDTKLPQDSEVKFSLESDEVAGCYFTPAIIEEANAIPGGSGGVTLVGRIKAEKKIGGPIGIDVLCMDGNGQILSGGGSIGFADEDKLEAGASGTFSVNPIGSCDRFLVSAGGYGF